MSLLRAAFTILGGASKGFNEGKIATRAAQQRAKELEDTRKFTTSERISTQGFQVDMANLQNKFDVASQLQAQLFEERNINLRAGNAEKLALLNQDIEEYMAGINHKYGLDLSAFNFKNTMIKQKDQQVFEGDKQEDEQQHSLFMQEDEQEFTTSENELNRLNALELKRMGIKGDKDIEILKGKISNVGNTVRYLINTDGQGVDYKPNLFTDDPEQPSSSGIAFIAFNDKDLEKNSDAWYRNHYNTWADPKQVQKTKALLNDLVKKGDIANIKLVINDMTQDIYGYKAVLQKSAKPSTQIVQEGASVPPLPNVPLTAISKLLDQFMQDDDDIFNNDSITDIVAQELTAVWLGTGEGDANRANNIQEVMRNMGYVQNSGNTLDITKKSNQAIVNDENDTKDFLQYLAGDMKEVTAGRPLQPHYYSTSDVSNAIFSKHIDKRAVPLAKMYSNHNNIVYADQTQGSAENEKILNSQGIMPSNHYDSGILNASEKLHFQAVNLKGINGRPINIYNYGDMQKVHAGLSLIMPNTNANGVRQSVDKLIENSGLDKKTIDAKYVSSEQAISTIDEILKLYKEFPDLPSGQAGNFFARLFEISKFNETGNFGSVIMGMFKDYEFTGHTKNNSYMKRMQKNLDEIGRLMGSEEPLSAQDAKLLANNQKEAYTALLAYQMAAAIQGGTGGRTISDQDVENIRRAMGKTFFDYRPGAEGRLMAFRNVVQKIASVNKVLKLGVDNGTVKGYKAAQAMADMYLGAPLGAFKNAGWTNNPIIMDAIFYDDDQYKISTQEIAPRGEETYVNEDFAVTGMKASENTTFTFTNADGKEYKDISVNKGQSLIEAIQDDYPDFEFLYNSPNLLEQLLEQGVITETYKNLWDNQRKGMENQVFKNEEDT
jgi:hypothetical protein